MIKRFKTAPNATPLEQAIAEWQTRNTWDPDVPAGTRRYYNPAVEGCGVRTGPSNSWQNRGQPGQWWPYPTEVRDCCHKLEEKVKRAVYWPMTNALLAHCASFDHIARKYGVDALDLKRAVRQTRAYQSLQKMHNVEPEPEF